jgi:hypothetical protein
MADHTELLKSMLQDIINDKQDNAQVTMHDYFVSKTREVSGMGQPVVSTMDDNDDDTNSDDE